MKYDPFQKQSMQYIDQGHSVLVSAPTGAGKTAIAEYVIDKAMRDKSGTIYTAPIKALSNQKYRDFKEKYGPDLVGIVTGDVTINPDAPIIIMTTEIFRNALFDDKERLLDKSWIIFDEIHYIDDQERGTVWEESIMFFPEHLKLLGLSATIPNIEEFATWIGNTIGQKISIVVEANRPVPLTHHFHCQGKIHSSLRRLQREGYHWRSPRQKFRDQKIRPNKIATLVHHIQDRELLPAIYFAFGRKRCREIAFELTDFDFLDSHETFDIMKLFEHLIETYGLENEPAAMEIAHLVKKGIAFHHAGMLPTLKEVVERLFTSRLLKFVCTTETFALGINMPARTVIFDELRKFYGTHFAALRTRDYYQMAGRAGRRGLDETGYVFSRINPHRIEFQTLKHMIFGNPEKVKSQFNSSYATILNLYKQYGEDLHKVYPKSFHYFQSQTSKRNEGFAQIKHKLDFLKSLGYIDATGLTEKGQFAASIFGYEVPMAEFYFDGFLEHLQEAQLNVLFASLIFEPRKNQLKPQMPSHLRFLRKRSKHILEPIYDKERLRHIYPKSKLPYFHLSAAVEHWSNGAEFSDIKMHTDTDDGEIIRYFRMVIQLLKELAHIKTISKPFQKKLHRCIMMMNRDIVDAEKQLRV